MSDTIDSPPTQDEAPPRRLPRRRRPLARRRLRRPRPLLRHQSDGLPNRVRGAGAGRRYRPAAVPRRVPRDPGRARRRVDRGRGAARAARPALAPPRRRPARLRRTLRALGSALLARLRQPLARGDPGRGGSSGGTSRVETVPRQLRLRRTHTAPPASPAPAPSAPRPPKRPSLFAPVLGALLAAAGVFGLLAVLDVYDVDVEVALAAGVAIVAVAVAIGAMTQRRVGGLVFLGLLLLAAFGAAAMTPVSISAGAGDRVERPLNADAVESSYDLGVGSLEIDLRAAALPVGHDVGRRQRRRRRAPDHGARGHRARHRRPRRRRRGRRARRSGRRRRRRPDTDHCRLEHPLRLALDLEAYVVLGSIEVRRG